jgi:HD-GYP domain-containing protein (c-di-GMP phosphodiesterase class II)
MHDRSPPAIPASTSVSSSPDARSGVRLAEVVAAFSLATDLGLGQPMEHLLRSWLIATRLGDRSGLDEESRRALFYVVTLGWEGCVADSPEVTMWFGDDILFRRDSYPVDRAGFPMLALALSHIGAGSPLPHRLRLAATLLASRGSGVQRSIFSHCLVTAEMAGRLGLGPKVCEWLLQVFTRWDGKGVPAGIAGEEIAPSVRVFHVADTAEVYHRTSGVDAAVAMAKSRRGTQFDPAVVDSFCTDAGDLLTDLGDMSDWSMLIDSEPSLRTELSNSELDSALETLADFTDLRSPARSGHSRAVAALAGQAAHLSGLSEDDVATVRRAGLLHDIGFHGVPATILDKPGPLSAAESERMRMHAYYTERMLARPRALARIGAIAALANERMDGSGYHRGLSGAAIPVGGRILAVADAYCAMIEPRAHRPAKEPRAAAAELKAEVRTGRMTADSVDAMLTAAGHGVGKRRTGPAGLTPREVEVLVLIARGASNRQVAQTLGIAEKTTGVHIERIYSKIGASTRSTATLFAMQHGLLDTLDPVDL